MVATWLLALVAGASATVTADVQTQVGYDSNVAYNSTTDLIDPVLRSEARDGYAAVHPEFFVSGAMGPSQLWVGYDLAYTQYFSVDNGYRLGQQVRFGGDTRVERFSLGTYLTGIDYQASAFRSDRMRLGEAGLVVRRDFGPVRLELSGAESARLFPFRPVGPSGEADRLDIGALTVRLPLAALGMTATYRVENIASNVPTFSGDLEVLSVGAVSAWRRWRAELNAEVRRYHLPDFPIDDQTIGRTDFQFASAARLGFSLGWLQPFAFALFETGTSNYPALVFRRGEAGLGLEVRWSDQRESPALQGPRLSERGRTVAFRFDLPGAKDVRLVGTFNRWNEKSLPLLEVRPGRFEATLPLAPGKYRYQLVVDGEHRTPPDAPEYAPDGMGGMDGVLRVPDAASEPSEKR